MIRTSLLAVAAALTLAACEEPKPATTAAAPAAQPAPPPPPKFNVALGRPVTGAAAAGREWARMRKTYEVVRVQPKFEAHDLGQNRFEMRVEDVTEAKAKEICETLKKQRFNACRILPARA